jgi:hypothetical protein
MLRRREKGEPIDPAVFANPVSYPHMVRMGVLSKTGRLCLLCGKEALLVVSDLEEPPLRCTMMSRHTTQSYN